MNAGTIPRSIRKVVEQSRQREEAELARAAQVEAVRIYAKRATGTGDIAEEFSLKKYFRLVYVRCHFSGGAGTADMRVGLGSDAGTQYDAELVTIKSAGAGTDVNWRVPPFESVLPSAWAFQPGDNVRVDWPNPDPGNTAWGIEVGLAPA